MTPARRFGECVALGFWALYEAGLVHSERSDLQAIDVYEHASFGRMLVLDGLVQTSERDEFTYHEMLVHVPLVSHPAPRTVLVVGGGDGGTLRRVLEHHTVERAVMVEIDGRVVDLCREHLPSVGGGAFDDPRTELVIGDGIAYVRDSREAFDAILVDSSEAIGPGVALFEQEFYANARARLAPGGVFCAQLGTPFFRQEEVAAGAENLRRAFGEIHAYWGNVPLYPGSAWAFAMTGAPPCDAAAAAKRAAERGLRPRYWTAALHGACFALPGVVEQVVGGATPPLQWGASPPEDERAAIPRG